MQGGEGNGIGNELNRRPMLLDNFESTNALFESQDNGGAEKPEIPNDIFEDDGVNTNSSIPISRLQKDSDDGSTTPNGLSVESARVSNDSSPDFSKIDRELNKLCRSSKEEGESMSSEDDEYGDESDLLSVASTMHSVSSMALLEPVLPATPSPLSEMYWCEPCATSFRVRGSKYTIDRKKTPSLSSAFRLITVDVCEVPEIIRTGFCAHPLERVQQALRRESEQKSTGDMPPFIFCVNIMVPGPPFYHMVFYYAVDDISQIKPHEQGEEAAGDPLNRLASKFFFGSSDKVRDSMFKLIPRVVSGNMIVKKAVGSKPTILGKKVKQFYIQDDRFLEVMVDIGSSAIAKQVLGLAKGYAKHLVVDMAFLLEGRSASCLPERVLGTVRLTHVDFKSKLRFVDRP